ncbi:OmpH family outer membrane protein, partial [Myxococcota bacterium]|nr:OmpH family outer membrane protein [Myxococcota bacterium]
AVVQPVQAGSAVKVGYVQMARILNEVEDGKSAKKKLQRYFDKRQKKLDALQLDLKKEKEDFDKRAGMMKPAVRQKKQEDLQRKFMEVQQTYMQLQKELIAEETKLTQEIANKARKIIERIGDRDGYTLVLEIGETVLYYKRHMDITDTVVRDYNRQYGKK